MGIGILRFFRRNPSIKLNVILYQEKDEWIAHCLQMDIVTANKDQRTVEDDIVDLIKTQVVYAFENENVENIFKSAPSTEWERLRQSQHCGIRKIKIAVSKTDYKNHSIPIREVELCLA